MTRKMNDAYLALGGVAGGWLLELRILGVGRHSGRKISSESGLTSEHEHPNKCLEQWWEIVRTVLRQLQPP